MKYLVVLVAALGIGSAFGADTLAVTGELSFGSGGLAEVAECGTNRVFTLGVMASNPYFRLTQRYDTVSEGGKFGVLVKVNGSLALRTSSNGRLILESPDVSDVVRGTCAAATPNKSLERTREG
jgi:hypothetical protein